MSRIAFSGITVDFGATRALDNITVSIEPGEVVGLLGHNGAGKSTLVSVAAGVLHPDSGQFTIDNAEVLHASPSSLSKLGLKVVNQEPALVGGLSVMDNLFLGRSDIPRNERADRAVQALGRLGLGHISPRVLVGELPIGQRQLVDLARGLVGGEIEVLLLDEPTAALGAAETELLHGLIREFSAAGTAVVYVSHRLPDILDVCTRVVVLNAGRVVQDASTADLSVRDLSVALAPGFEELEHHETDAGAPVVLQVQGPGELTFHRGEIVGIFGMAAGNQFKLMESLFGWRKHHATADFQYFLHDNIFDSPSPAYSIQSGVVMVPAERETDGLLTQLSAGENVLLPWYRQLSRGAVVMPGTGAGAYAQAREEMKIVGPGGDAPITAFSGGNKQKHLLARWMYPHRPQVLLLNQPTQGVDIGAKNDIVRALRALADAGVTVVVASSESDEIARMCSRSYVMYDTAVAEVAAGPQMEENLLRTLLELAGR